MVLHDGSVLGARNFVLLVLQAFVVALSKSAQGHRSLVTVSSSSSEVVHCHLKLER